MFKKNNGFYTVLVSGSSPKSACYGTRHQTDVVELLLKHENSIWEQILSSLSERRGPSQKYFSPRLKAEYTRKMFGKRQEKGYWILRLRTLGTFDEKLELIVVCMPRSTISRHNVECAIE